MRLGKNGKHDWKVGSSPLDERIQVISRDNVNAGVKFPVIGTSPVQASMLHLLSDHLQFLWIESSLK